MKKNKLTNLEDKVSYESELFILPSFHWFEVGVLILKFYCIMKATDLMIGDWVIRRGVPEEQMRLYNMNASRGLAYLDQDGRGVAELFENIEPIPLTEEILEKNGWKKQIWWRYKQSDVVTYDISEELFPIEFSGNEFWLVDNCSDDGDYGYESNWIVEVKYVHELQHALKLWGIKKEIVL